MLASPSTMDTLLIDREQSSFSAWPSMANAAQTWPLVQGVVKPQVLYATTANPASYTSASSLLNQ